MCAGSGGAQSGAGGGADLVGGGINKTGAILEIFQVMHSRSSRGIQETAVPKAGQEAVLAWLAAAAGVNLVRVSGGEVRLLVSVCCPMPHISAAKFCCGGIMQS